jgi:hypothetical protein
MGVAVFKHLCLSGGSLEVVDKVAGATGGASVLTSEQKSVLKRRIKRIIKRASRLCPCLEERVERYIYKLFKNVCREIDPSVECGFRGIILSDDYGYYDVLHEEHLLKRPVLVDYSVHYQWLCFDVKRGSRVYTYCRRIVMHFLHAGLVDVVLAIEDPPAVSKYVHE